MTKNIIFPMTTVKMTRKNGLEIELANVIPVKKSKNRFTRSKLLHSVVLWQSELQTSMIPTFQILDELDRLAERHPDLVQVIHTRSDWSEARASGRFAAVAGMEGGHPLEDSLETLEHFASRGLRVLTLVWNNHLTWARSCQPDAPEGTPEGLSSFGEHIVGRCNELGILVDLSHAGEQTFFDALESGEGPAIASHSGCKALHDHPRNLTDEQVRALAATGGVVGLPFLPSFLDRGAQERAARCRNTPGYQALRSATDCGLVDGHPSLGPDFLCLTL